MTLIGKSTRKGDFAHPPISVAQKFFGPLDATMHQPLVGRSAQRPLECRSQTADGHVRGSCDVGHIYVGVEVRFQVFQDSLLLMYVQSMLSAQEPLRKCSVCLSDVIPERQQHVIKKERICFVWLGQRRQYGVSKVQHYLVLCAGFDAIVQPTKRHTLFRRELIESSRRQE